MAGKGSKDTRVKNIKQYNENFDRIKRKGVEGFIQVKGKLVKKY